MKGKKNAEYEESQITMYIFGLKFYFAQKQFEKKFLYLYTIKFYSHVAEYLKHSNDTPELNIHKYANYNIIEIYIHRLCTTTDFHSDGLLDNDVREVLSFQKNTKASGKDIFHTPQK